MSAKGKVAGVQVLRAVLFVGIIAFHCGLPASEILWGGVEAFFVISSYFLTKKLLKSEEISIADNLIKRINRLYPQYILTLAGAICLCVVINGTIPIKDTLIHLLSLQNFNWMLTGYTSDLVSYTGHTWTLAIEIWMFVIWMIAFKLIRSKNGRMAFCVCMMAAAIVYRVISIEAIGDNYVTSLFPIAHADAFAAGSLMAIASGRNRKKNIVYSVFIMAGIVFLIGCFIYTARVNNVSVTEGYALYKSSKYYLTNAFTGNVYLAITLISMGLLYFSFKIPDVRMLKPLVALGNLSYTGYLVHWLVRVVLIHFMSNPWVLFFAVLIVTIISSLVIDKVIGAIRIRMTTGR